MADLVLQQQQDSVLLQGQLTRNTVMSIKNRELKSLLARPELALDLTQLTKVDSAGVAWLLLLVERANAGNCVLKLLNLPQELLKLATLSGVTEFLPIA